MAVAGAVIAYGLYLVCVRNSPERYRPETRPPSLRESFRALAGNRPLAILGASQLCLQTGLFTLGGVQAHYAAYVLGDSAGLVWLIGATSLATVVVMPFLPRVVARLGKKRTFLGGMVAVIGATAWLSFVPAVLPVVTVSFFALGLAQNVVNALLWPFAADVADYGEWRSGHRSDGGTMAVFFFFRRVAQASAGGLGGWGLALGGFAAGGAAQPESALTAIRALVGVVPAALCVAGTVVFGFYTLDDRRHAEILRELGRV